MYANVFFSRIVGQIDIDGLPALGASGNSCLYVHLWVVSIGMMDGEPRLLHSDQIVHAPWLVNEQVLR